MKASKLFGGRLVALSAAALLALGASGTQGLAAQQDLSDDLTQLQEHHPDLASLLEAVDAANHAIFEAVVAGESDRQTYDRLVRDILASPRSEASMASQEMASAIGNVVPVRVVDALDRANAFHHELLNIYANPDAVAGAFREVQSLVTRYTSAPEIAFLVDPKDMMITTDGGQAGAFRTTYPNLNGLLWANRWLQLAAFEPLVRYTTVHERAAGISAVVARYWYLLSNPPETFPTEMPMAPTIAPTMVAYHPRAAAIVDNSFMYQDMTADALISESVGDEGPWLDQLLADFQDPEFMWTSWYNWNRMAILHGVGNQGGWATGIIPDPKQTQLQLNQEGHDMEGGHMVIPGMPGPGM